MALISQSMITRWQMESTHTPPAINGDPWVSRGLDRKYIYIYISWFTSTESEERRNSTGFCLPFTPSFRSEFSCSREIPRIRNEWCVDSAGWGGLIAVEPSPRPVASTGFNRATYRGWHGFEMIEIRMGDKITLFLQRSWQVVLRFNF